MSQHPRELWRNPWSTTGGVMFALAVLFLFSFLFFDLVTHKPNPYIGLFTYLVFPGFLFVGGALIVFGLLLARRRVRREGLGSDVHYYPRIDLNDPGQRRVFGIGFGATAITLPIVGLMSYRGYHYTESNDFCGKVCHEVMEPQHAAYDQSPHSHVDCAECHIGSGASWYVKSKLSGLKQVWAVTVGNFPRPIPPAIRELRPAAETCGRCHWPARFYGDQLVTLNKFTADEKNTKATLQMMMKTGGSGAGTGPASGIHWHISEDFSVDYVSTDDHFQDIPWVRLRQKSTGETRVFRSDGKPTGDPPPEGVSRTMDCMDCHNRPTHIFRTPDYWADRALDQRPSLRALPFAKRELVAALVKPHGSKDAALAAIAESLTSFYETNYPEVYAARSADVARLVEAGKSAYARSVFPSMNVTWRTYPNNIGHKVFPGCFRCHDSRHVDQAGKPISHECATCHEFLVPVADEEGAPMRRVSGWVHPYELKGTHAQLRCDQCHTGGVAPTPSCEGCHADVTAFRAGSSPAFASFDIAADKMAEAVNCEACHDVAEPLKLEVIDALCMECHEDEEEQFRGMLASWKSEMTRRLGDADHRGVAVANETLSALRAAGPLHNVEASRKILDALGIPDKKEP